MTYHVLTAAKSIFPIFVSGKSKFNIKILPLNIKSRQKLSIFEEILQLSMKDKIPNIDIEKSIDHWIKSSEEDFNTMLGLYDIKRYSWSLFIGHISVEKLLKALYLKRNEQHAPFIHNLYRLAELCKVDIPEEYSDWLDKITTFNLKVRYDDYKQDFYNQCTLDFTTYWIEKIKTLR